MGHSDSEKIIIIFGGSLSEQEDLKVISRQILEGAYEDRSETEIINLNSVSLEKITLLEKENILCFILDPYIEFGPLFENGITDIRDLLYAKEIRFSGPRFLSTRLTANKFITKRVISTKEVKLIKDLIVKYDYDIKNIKSKLGIPLIIKPLSRGAGEDVYLVNNEIEAATYLDYVIARHRIAFCEEYIKGVEVSVPVLKINKRVRTLTPVQIEIKGSKIYDAKTKATYGSINQIIPANIHDAEAKIISSYSEELYNRLQFNGLLRVDFIIDKGTVYFLEANSYPSLGSVLGISIPAALHDGLSYKQVICAIAADT